MASTLSLSARTMTAACFRPFCLTPCCPHLSTCPTFLRMSSLLGCEPVETCLTNCKCLDTAEFVTPACTDSTVSRKQLFCTNVDGGAIQHRESQGDADSRKSIQASPWVPNPISYISLLTANSLRHRGIGRRRCVVLHRMSCQGLTFEGDLYVLIRCQVKNTGPTCILCGAENTTENEGFVFSIENDFL